MKRIVSFFLAILLAFSFSACSVETVDQYNSRISAEQSSSTEISSKKSDASDSEEDSSSKDESDSQSQQQAQPDTSGNNNNGASKSGGSSGSSKSSGSSDSPKSPGASSSGTSSKSSSSSPQQAAETITITISVTFSQIVGHADLDNKYASYNGVLISSTSIKLEKGATVYNALQSACSANGIAIGYQSGYVYAISGLNQKQFGDGSGWKYKVNGTTPNVGCNSYKLSDGDTIEWYYTTTTYG